MQRGLPALVDAALAGKHEFDDALRQVGAAIDAAPRSRRLRRLRIRLAHAADMRAEHLADLHALCAIDARDRLAAQELALREFAWASDQAGSAPGPTAAEPSGRLTQLLGLLHQLGTRATRLAWALDTWDATRVWEPWSRLQIALHACALHPDDAALQRHLALSWAQLVQHPSALESADGRIPPGFALDATGNLCDALIAGRALAALDAALLRLPGDAGLLFSRALVNQGTSRFLAAELDFAGAARAWDREADRPDIAAADAASARAFADRAFSLAQRCSGGRETLARPWLPDSGGGPHTPGTLFSMPTMPNLGAGQRGPHRPPGGAGDETTEQMRSRLAAQARQVVEQLGALLDPAPGAWSEAPAPAQDAAALRPLPAAAAMDAAGLEPLCWAEHPSLHDAGGTSAPCRVWCSHDGGVTIVAVALGDQLGVEVSTEFADGRHLVTTNARGRTCLAGGPQLDSLHVDATRPLGSLLALHRARVALRRAQEPGATLRATRSFADFAAAQQRQRDAEQAHRTACGMDEFEALAVPSDVPEEFAPLLQAAALQWLEFRHPA